MKPIFTHGQKVFLKCNEEAVIITAFVHRERNITYLCAADEGEIERQACELIEERTYSGND
jgi:hypothetical protein